MLTDAGDTLALFIVRELADTFDPAAHDEQQLKTAVHAIERAIQLGPKKRTATERLQDALNWLGWDSETESGTGDITRVRFEGEKYLDAPMARV